MRQKRDEGGNSIIIYVLLFPVVFGVFGVAVDLAVGTYTNTNLQSGLDTATQSALSRASNPGTNGNITVNPKLTKDAAHQYIVDYYDVNRTDSSNSNENPFIICQTVAGPEGKLVKPDSGCAWTENSYSFTIAAKTLNTKIELYETSKPVFIHIIGITEIKYTISSSARTTYATN